MTRPCTLCGSERRRVFTATVLGKHDVDYFHCEHCGLLQTQEPYWLDEAYGEAIADADTGLVQRNLATARRLSAVLYFCFERDGTYLDSAGGYGLLTRLMRDIGFDFYWHDEFCANRFARGFEGARIDGPATAVTAFEVLEHVPNPLQFVGDVLRDNESRTLIFSTELFAGPPPDPDAWWYYAREAGQHISFYQRRTLQFLADRLSLTLYSNRSFHILTDRRINATLFDFLTAEGSWLGYAWARTRMASLTLSDSRSVNQESKRQGRD